MSLSLSLSLFFFALRFSHRRVKKIAKRAYPHAEPQHPASCGVSQPLPKAPSLFYSPWSPVLLPRVLIYPLPTVSTELLSPSNSRRSTLPLLSTARQPFAETLFATLSATFLFSFRHLSDVLKSLLNRFGEFQHSLIHLSFFEHPPVG